MVRSQEAMPGYNQLYDRYYPRLCDLARSRFANRQLAEDLVTDRFISLWEHYGQFRTEWAAIQYLYTGIHLACRYPEGPACCMIPDDDSLYPGFKETVQVHPGKLEWNRAAHVLHKLSQEHRKIFSLYYRYGFSIRQLAAYFNCSSSSIQHKLAWSIYILKKYFLKPKAPV